MVTARLGGVLFVPVRLTVARLAIGPATMASVGTMAATSGARPVHPDKEQNDRDPKPIGSKKFQHGNVSFRRGLARSRGINRSHSDGLQGRLMRLLTPRSDRRYWSEPRLAVHY